jgi:ATP-dependent Clp protease adaptor protein ClpS
MTLLHPELDERTSVDADARPDVPWVTVVWDDPVNLMSYVTFVFQQHFGFSRERAERLMHEVDREGRAIVATGPREAMEAHVEAMHGYGLQSSVDRAPAP